MQVISAGRIATSGQQRNQSQTKPHCFPSIFATIACQGLKLIGRGAARRKDSIAIQNASDIEMRFIIHREVSTVIVNCLSNLIKHRFTRGGF
jgi:hypothetical protein